MGGGLRTAPARWAASLQAMSNSSELEVLNQENYVCMAMAMASGLSTPSPNCSQPLSFPASGIAQTEVTDRHYTKGCIHVRKQTCSAQGFVLSAQLSAISHSQPNLPTHSFPATVIPSPSHEASPVPVHEQGCDLRLHPVHRVHVGPVMQVPQQTEAGGALLLVALLHQQ